MGSDGKNKELAVVPYVVYEMSEVRAEERYDKLNTSHKKLIRCFVAVMILVLVLILINNALWIWAWSSYDYVSEEYNVEADKGNANYITGNNNEVHNNGEGYSQETEQNEKVPQF